MSGETPPAPGRFLAMRRVPLPPDRARRMRVTATAMLVFMAGVFLFSRQYLDLHPAWGYVHAFAEAAMVGGLADWFAVTALFRHPLGVPIPHTAIIPENKDRIADTMAQFLRDNFLTPAVVARRMQAMNLARAADGVFEAVGDRARIPPAHRFGHELDDLPAVAGRDADRGAAREAVDLHLQPRIVAQRGAEFGQG